MIRLRFFFLAAAILAAWGAEVSAQSAWVFKFANSAEPSSDLTCKVYALNDVEPALAAWIAQTIPEMIEPGSWNTGGGKGSLSFFAPKKIMVVRHTAETHARVGEFLKEVTHAAAPATFATTPREPAILRAHHLMPALKTEPAEAKPLPIRRVDGNPRHLFQIVVDGLEAEGMKLKNFTLRYEGEGIIDSTIAELIKSMQGAGTWSNAPATSVMPTGSYLPCPPPSFPTEPTAPTSTPSNGDDAKPASLPMTLPVSSTPLIRAGSVTTPAGTPIGASPPAALPPVKALPSPTGR